MADNAGPVPGGVAHGGVTNGRRLKGPKGSGGDAAGRWRGIGLWLIPPALILAIICAGILYLTAPVRTGRIARGVSVNGVDLSNLTPGAARQLLAKALPSLERDNIILEAAGRSTRMDAAQLGARWDPYDAVAQAMTVGRTPGFLDSLRALATAMRSGRHFRAPVAVDRSRLIQALKPLARRAYVRPRNASIQVSYDYDGPSLEKTPMAPGQRLDMAGSARAVARLLERRGGLGEGAADRAIEPAVELPLCRVLPAVTDREISSIDGLIAEYSTHYHPYQQDRTHNLWLASSAINGALVLPGQTFSYNRRVGQRRISRGYRAAPIFVKGKVVDDTGGGVCQVATTVYNAALLSNCRIVERNPHSMRTSYSIPGRDATVAWDALDLRFRNTHKEPILLTTGMGNGELTVRVWGHRHPGERVGVYVQDVGDGVITYRVVHRADGTVVRQVVSRDPYPKAPQE